jgi:hypothetical protein
MRRKVLILASMLSLLFCVAAIVVGVWAMRGLWSVNWRMGGWEYSVNGPVGRFGPEGNRVFRAPTALGRLVSRRCG